MNPVRGFSPVFIIIVIAIVGGALAALYLSNPGNFLQKSLESSQSAPTPSLSPTTNQPSPTPSSDETANWKTYTNTSLGYTIKYPENVGIDEFEQTTILYIGEKLDVAPGGPAEDTNAAIAIYDRSDPKYKNAQDACNVELCQNLNSLESGKYWTKEPIKVNNATGLRLYSSERPFNFDHYLSNNSNSVIVRIPYGVSFGTNEEKSALMNTLNKMFDTFKFVE